MKLTSIKLIQFKNYQEHLFSFSGKFVSITGNNGIGKTNLLDAIYYTCIGKSNFQSSDKLIVKEGEDFFRLEAQYDNGSKQLAVCLKVKPGSVKELEVNGTKLARLSDHLGIIPVVIICPDDIHHLMEGNEARRGFINQTLIQFDPQYTLHLNTYQKLLKQRNALLKDFQERKYIDEDLIDIITTQMAEPAQYVYEARQRLVTQIQEPLAYFGSVMSNQKEHCRMEYSSQLDTSSFLSLSRSGFAIDKITGRTGTGIHKDEINFYINDRLIKDFASQGQLKTFIFALKLAQSSILYTATNERPIFLLDDIFDKLDKTRVGLLLKVLGSHDVDQVFITTTDAGAVSALSEEPNLVQELMLA